jgi:hypothetical protein
MLAGKLRHRRQRVLHSAELIERALRLDWQKLIDDAVDGLERQPSRRQIHLVGWRDHVRLLADVENQRFALGGDDGLKK